MTIDEQKQKNKIDLLHKKEEERVTQILSEKYNLPYANLAEMTVDLDYLKLIPEDKSKEGKIVIFQGIGKKIQIAVQNPELPLVKNLLKELENKNYEIQLFLSSLSSLEKIWKKYKEVPAFEELSRGAIEISDERIATFLSQITTLKILQEAFLKRIESKEKRRISELLEILLSGSLNLNASDIHIEPQEKDIKIRLRLDGVLHELLNFNQKAFQLLLSRIKLISEMKLNIREKAQDGRFSIKARDNEMEVRSSILPGPYGESVVLRLLNPQTISVSFEELGMNLQLQELMKKEIKRPNGMILTTGPTGSGKTTTLYAFLKKIKIPGIKIITIEEPIEYHLEGITQTQTNPQKGYGFSTGLSSILRQDPDVIMVGEIRELKAATIALNAALTGHLVFSTLHTNDAAGTIPRLIELGANPTIIAPAVNVTMAQRLVRKLCENCKKGYTPNKEEEKIIKEIISSMPKNIQSPPLNELKIFKSVGCEKCNKIGYKGRVGIFEAIIINEDIEKVILERPSESKIKTASIKQNLLNMRQDAILKILNGITSFEETQRVIELA